VGKKKTAAALIQGKLESGPELDLLKTIVMERIMSKRPVPVVGLDEEYRNVHQLVEHTITAGEGNSMLLIGARGSGKTALVNKVLSEISKDNADEYHVVRLNGFIHTDDKIALREIWRQLGKEMDVEDDGGLGKNYADTLTTLLALLSHPSEHTGELTEQVAKAVIFVMDEFDLFAMHPRQTLLYNLFDIAQSRKAPIAVLGLTTRIDVTNSLEKRVKSRFSHRYVHLSLAKSFTAYQELCKASLIIQPDQLSVEERSILTSAPNSTPGNGKRTKTPTKSTAPDILTTWNGNINVSTLLTPRKQVQNTNTSRSLSSPPNPS
jgi:origin recognition complex subunit 4